MIAIVLAALTALAVWVVLDTVMDGLQQPGFGGQTPQPLGAAVVATASLVGGLLGWLALIVTERVLRRGRRTWLTTVLVGLFLSVGAPLSGTGIGQGDRLALALLHVVVGLVAIPLLYRTAGPSGQPVPEDL